MHQGARGSELRSRNSEQPMFVNQRSICCDGLAEEGRNCFWGQQIKFRHRDLKHGTFCPAMNTRRGSIFRQLLPHIAPVSTSPQTPKSSPAKISVSTAATRFCGDDDALSHRPRGLNRGPQSLRWLTTCNRSSPTASALSIDFVNPTRQPVPAPRWQSSLTNW